ncbi:hypothetical protein V8D89_014795 [Ganoderma adspersum]
MLLSLSPLLAHRWNCSWWQLMLSTPAPAQSCLSTLPGGPDSAFPVPQPVGASATSLMAIDSSSGATATRRYLGWRSVRGDSGR